MKNMANDTIYTVQELHIFYNNSMELYSEYLYKSSNQIFLGIQICIYYFFKIVCYYRHLHLIYIIFTSFMPF